MHSEAQLFARWCEDFFNDCVHIGCWASREMAPSNNTMIATNMEIPVGNNRQLDPLKEFPNLRSQNILLDCLIMVGSKWMTPWFRQETEKCVDFIVLYLQWNLSCVLNETFRAVVRQWASNPKKWGRANWQSRNISWSRGSCKHSNKRNTSWGEVPYNITNNGSCGYKRLGMGWLRTWKEVIQVGAYGMMVFGSLQPR